MVIKTVMTRKSPKSSQKLSHEKVLQCLDTQSMFGGVDCLADKKSTVNNTAEIIHPETNTPYLSLNLYNH